MSPPPSDPAPTVIHGATTRPSLRSRKRRCDEQHCPLGPARGSPRRRWLHHNAGHVDQEHERTHHQRFQGCCQTRNDRKENSETGRKVRETEHEARSPEQKSRNAHTVIVGNKQQIQFVSARDQRDEKNPTATRHRQAFTDPQPCPNAEGRRQRLRNPQQGQDQQIDRQEKRSRRRRALQQKTEATDQQKTTPRIG